ncbi:MAG: glycoside hydrolase [Anaerolineae bacterium]|nr:glycoside hydrolase [Anaerolineae bacterium]MCI0609789.1 glycoside hydrolase [Anaerolineae bacterium]
MKALVQPTRSVKVILFVLLALALTVSAVNAWGNYQQQEFLKTLKGKAPNRKGEVKAEIINSSPIRPVSIAAAPVGFTPQTRLGFAVDNEWEPAIASDRFGHVYILYAQYSGVPGCPNCSNPTQVLQISNDRGATWGSPTVIYPAGATTGGQWDSQIVVDPVDGRTVYASFMQNNKSDIIVAKSTDFGITWSFVTSDATNAGTDKPILAVRGQDVYVVYTHAQTTFAAYSHNGGASFTEVKVSKGGKLGWALAGGGAVTPNGNVFFSWAGYEGNGGASGNVNLYVSKSTNGGATWTSKVIDVSSSPPQCPEFFCGWAYLGAQMVMTSDANGVIYLLWNAGSTATGPERIYFAKSTDGGNTYSTKVDISTAPAGSHHAFPAIAAVGNGDIRISWMDARAANGGLDRWNVYYRSSTNGGSTWSSEVDLSTFVSGFSYIFNDGFRFPFGDYYEIDVDDQGTNHVVFGEALNYDSPGSIWYVKGN